MHSILSWIAFYVLGGSNRSLLGSSYDSYNYYYCGGVQVRSKSPTLQVKPYGGTCKVVGDGVTSVYPSSSAVVSTMSEARSVVGTKAYFYKSSSTSGVYSSKVYVDTMFWVPLEQLLTNEEVVDVQVFNSVDVYIA